MNTPIKVVIVDDHPMVAEGIQAVLESYDDIQVLCALKTGREIVDQAEEVGLGGTSLLLRSGPGRAQRGHDKAQR